MTPTAMHNDRSRQETSDSLVATGGWMPAGTAAIGVHPATEIWNGRSWHGLPTPAPVHAADLSGVSCASRSSCMAIGGNSSGQTFALAWNGRRWRIVAAARLQAAVTGISCPAPTLCMAAGRTGIDFNQGSSAAAEMWNGSTWSAQVLPAVPGVAGSSLSAVSCATMTSCIAVGSAMSSSPGNPLLTLAEAWDGTSWRVLATPSPGTEGSMLNGISCTSAGGCIAVGSAVAVPGTFSPLIERWDGLGWSVLAAAATPDGTLAGISCTSPASCMAVGDNALTERWDGTTWRLVDAPAPYGDSSMLARVSCSAADACMAVGGSFRFLDSLAEQWDGRSWQVRRTGQLDELAAVSCPSAARCMAVGRFVSPADRVATLAQEWDGRSWRQRRTPGPAASGPLSDVSCVRSSFCMAVGGSFLGVIERWNGRRWRLVTTGRFPLDSVSCASAARCMAVGDTGPWAWNGRRWRPVRPATPAGSESVRLHDLSCPAAARCIAVGDYFTGTRFTKNFTLAEEWNGRRWRILATPNPGNDTFDTLAAVDCAGPSSCIAVGRYFDNSGGHNLAERWNGRAWQPQTPPGPTGLLDVSCPAAAWCMAVGRYVPRFRSSEASLTERWNGRAWQRVRHAGLHVGLHRRVLRPSCQLHGCRPRRAHDTRRGVERVQLAAAQDREPLTGSGSRHNGGR